MGPTNEESQLRLAANMFGVNAWVPLSLVASLVCQSDVELVKLAI
jgi:hypothetical protein